MPDRQHPLGTVEAIDEEDIKRLADDLRGDLILPGHEEYEHTRDVWNGLVNRYPAVIIRAESGVDVARGVQFAREIGLDIAVRGGSHHQTGDAVVDNGVVIDLVELDGVRVDPDEQVARVGPGVRAGDLLAETQEYGLATPTGGAGDVGIAGTTLGGGIGWIRRKHGLSIDALRAVELVTPDGKLRKASPQTNEDLFWAVRGGGGNFGIVTNFEFKLYEVGPIVAGLSVFYPFEQANDVLETYRTVSADAPAELTTTFLSGHVPALPAIPEELHGEDAVAVLGCYTGDPDEGMKTVTPLLEVSDPLVDMSEPMPYEVLHELGTQLYPWGRKYVHRSVFVDELTDELLDVVADLTGSAPGPLDAIGVWQMGGNVGHGPDAAFAWDDEAYMITIEANWEHHENTEEFAWAREAERVLRDLGGVGSYAGFTGVEEQEWEDWSTQVYGDSIERLARIKAEYDPENVLSHNVTVQPTTPTNSEVDG